MRNHAVRRRWAQTALADAGFYEVAEVYDAVG